MRALVVCAALTLALLSVASTGAVQAERQSERQSELAWRRGVQVELERRHAEIERLRRMNRNLRAAVARGVPWELRRWFVVGACESGLRADAVSPGGRYQGAWQFALGSWRAVGGRGLPSRASIIEQLYRAELLQRLQGWGAWPYCARGLS